MPVDSTLHLLLAFRRSLAPNAQTNFHRHRARKASACRSAAMSAAHVESALQSDKAPSNLTPRLASLAAATQRAPPVDFSLVPNPSGQGARNDMQARAGTQRPTNLATVACGSQLTADSATVISSTKGRSEIRSIRRHLHPTSLPCAHCPEAASSAASTAQGKLSESPKPSVIFAISGWHTRPSSPSSQFPPSSSARSNSRQACTPCPRYSHTHPRSVAASANARRQPATCTRAPISSACAPGSVSTRKPSRTMWSMAARDDSHAEPL